MSKHYVKSAHLTRKNLVFKDGAWRRKGLFCLNSGARGSFEVVFLNGYLNELFIPSLPDIKSFKYIKSKTFYDNELVFAKQIIEIIRPGLEEQILEIREKEKNLVNPKITDVVVNSYEEQVGVNFRIENEDKKHGMLLKKEDGEWELSLFDIRGVASGFISSTWAQELWEVTRNNEEARFIFLVL
ncbi:hypothetical protein U8V72_15415 [Priestia filamentosa]|uniref:hypothetical protein n=1 Tax=Priestia filamentosa TaxID=1402861 RepID=UPI0005896CBE